MALALVTTSHSPLMGRNDPGSAIETAVEAAFARARDFIHAYEPELVVAFAPDHYNAFFYRLLPAFCIGASASALGDYGTAAGPLDVPRHLARELAQWVLDRDVDVAVSERMDVDHGFAQPLHVLFGAIDAVPVIPVFVNSVAEPMGPLRRARLLGQAIGTFWGGRAERILLLGSGGLSHDPPVPELATAPGPVAERLVAGGSQTPAERADRESRVVQAGRDLAAGTSDRRPINPEWDEAFLDLLAGGQLEQLDRWTNADISTRAGRSAHEVRTWVAAYAALAAAGPYEMRYRFYHPIPEWIAGFGITTAGPATTAAGTVVQ